MFIRLKNQTAATKSGVEYRLQSAEGKLGKGYRLSCDRWVEITDVDLANLELAYGKDTFVTSKEATKLTPAKVVLGGTPGRAPGGDPQNPKTAAKAQKRKAAAPADEKPDLNPDDGPKDEDPAGDGVTVNEDGSAKVEL